MSRETYYQRKARIDAHDERENITTGMTPAEKEYVIACFDRKRALEDAGIWPNGGLAGEQWLKEHYMAVSQEDIDAQTLTLGPKKAPVTVLRNSVPKGQVHAALKAKIDKGTKRATPKS